MSSLSTDLVVGVDGSDGSLLALRWAVRMAKERHRGLRLVYAVDEVPVAIPHARPLDAATQRAIRERGRRVLQRAQEAAAEIAPAMAAKVVFRPEPPAVALCAESADAGLLVLGTPELRPLGRILLGSVSVALAARAECPVAFIRPHAGEEAPPTGGPVVVGVDAIPASEEAIALAFEEASWRRAPLIAVHCRRGAFLSGAFEEGGRTGETRRIEAHERELLAQRLTGWHEKYPEVEVERVVVKARPAEGLLAYADRAQLLVVGSRGRGGVAGLALGSTSQNLISSALCPVVVARGAAPARR
ncbi:universal stress protein [Amycolatopsis sp. NPDC051903]|uniref:universal stress protein n=1 Tax=Amycolatopsis sp. NPDC051903 TaxID=3363936 RepID=UPI0037BCEDD2